MSIKLIGSAVDIDKHVWQSNTGYTAIFRALLLIIRRAQLFNFERRMCI
jgi:hypothetical protein